MSIVADTYLAGHYLDLSTLTVAPATTRELTKAAVRTLEATDGAPVDAFARTRAELVKPETLASFVAGGLSRGVDAEAAFLAFHNVHAPTATEAAVRWTIRALGWSTPRPFDQTRRDERAGAVRTSRAIVGYGSTYFVQPSDPSASPYTVTLDGAGHCTCPDATHRVTRARLAGDDSAACKHLVAVRLHVRTAAATAA